MAPQNDGVSGDQPQGPVDEKGTPIGPHHPNTPIDLPYADSICALLALGGPGAEGAEERLELIRREYAAGVLRLLGAAYTQAASLLAGTRDGEENFNRD